MSDSDEEYVEEIRIVRRKKETYRSNSSKSDEFESDLLRNKSNKSVAGPTESRSVDEDELRRRYRVDPAPARQRELSPGEQAMLDALSDLGTMLMNEAVVPLVRDVALPRVKVKLSELVERRRAKALDRAEAKQRALTERAAELESYEEAVSFDGSPGMGVVESAQLMSRSEYLLARLQLKLAEDFVAEQQRFLARASVTEEDLSPELEHTLALMLEGRADELNEEQREAVAEFLRQAGRAPKAKLSLPRDTAANEIRQPARGSSRNT